MLQMPPKQNIWDITGSKIKQVKERWVADAPTSRFTSDGNADRWGNPEDLIRIFSGWVADTDTT